MPVTDMDETARRLHAQYQQRQQYDHLFAAERDHLESRLRDLEAKNTDLLMQVRDAERKIIRLETVAEYETRNKGRRAKGSGGMKGQRNRVVFHVTATMTDHESACLLGQTLIEERGPESSKSMKVTAWGVNGNVLGFVVDYTVVGGHPADIWRDGVGQRPGMLNRVTERLGVTVLEVECKQHLRERVEDDQMPSEGL